MKRLLFLFMVIFFLILHQPIPGDINLTGFVGNSDYTLVKNHILKIEKLNPAQMDRADINKDGDINSTDLAWIRHIINNGG